MAATIGAIAAARRPKWHYPPPPPTPRILHLPRRPRRRALQKVKKPSPETQNAPRSDRTLGKLETLFGQERAFAKESVPIVVLHEKRRERVEERESSEIGVKGGGGERSELEEEKWRFQAEMLRAECNLLRMEKEIAVKKLGRVRVKTQRALRSVIHSLVSERKKISEGKNSTTELEEQIQQLTEKLEKLKRNLESKNPEIRRKCHNFDKQAAILQGELRIFRGNSDEVCVKKIREMAEVSLSVKTMCRFNETLMVSSDDSNVEILRKKMEGLSNGMLLERMKEECGSMLSTANSSVASSASNSKRIEFFDTTSSSSIQHLNKEENESACSGRCKAIIRRILKQVRAETEQWSQMQEMLGKVREEMEELQASRDFWEDRALDYDQKMQSLHSDVEEWRQKAISSENKAIQLEAQMYFLKKELERARKEERADESLAKSSPPRMAVDGQHEMEKRVLICRLKENQNNNVNRYIHRQPQASVQSQSKKKQNEEVSRTKAKTKSNIGIGVARDRPALRDIGNSCVSLKQHSKAIFPLMPSGTSKNV